MPKSSLTRNPWGARLRGFIERSQNAKSVAEKRGYAYIARKIIAWKMHLWDPLPEEDKLYLRGFSFDEPRTEQKDVTNLLEQRRQWRDARSAKD